eukprot:TRINITY_DN5855_c1_g1_i1.p1 TRINITY_DN5855_c1_g1~~TRINITY_DN5855_c1_g1_i1.p1  ORF type:complete len:334 (-),score=89.64 TRINITY_DN5855_c1_g1_i1:306-1307(-)
MVKVHAFGASPRPKIQKSLDDEPLVRWAAPEVLAHKRYSKASDAWSFAVVLHEMLSRGALPYDDLATDADVAKAVTSKGRRLAAVEDCPPDLYKLMLRCWDHNPAQRPTFDEIKEVLSTLQPKDSPSLQRRPSPGSYDYLSQSTGPAPYATETLPDIPSPASDGDSIRSPTNLPEPEDGAETDHYQASPVREPHSDTPRRRESPRRGSSQRRESQPPPALSYQLNADLGDATRPHPEERVVSSLPGLVSGPTAPSESPEAAYSLEEIQTAPDEATVTPALIPLGESSSPLVPEETSSSVSSESESPASEPSSDEDSDVEFERRMGFDCERHCE